MKMLPTNEMKRMKMRSRKALKKRLLLVFLLAGCMILFPTYAVMRMLSDIINPDGKGGCKPGWFKPLNKSVEMNPEPTPLVKNIFIGWQQGIENAPPVVVDAVNSWVKNNPAWNVTILSDENEELFLNDTDFYALFGDKRKLISRAAFSDLIRIWLLEKYGGAWADATTLNTIPLDSWLPFIVDKSEEFFAFRNPDYNPDLTKETYPMSSWFLYGTPRSTILKKWKQQIVKYWDGRTSPHAYFWVHFCLFHVLKDDKKLAEKWMEKVVIDREIPHLLQFTKPTNMTCEGFLGLSPVFKLSHYDGKSKRYIEVFDSLKENNCTFCKNETDCAQDSKAMFETLKKSCDLKFV